MESESEIGGVELGDELVDLIGDGCVTLAWHEASRAIG
jgi:hypothetical protein